MARPRKALVKLTKKSTSARVTKATPKVNLTPFEKVQKDLQLSQSSFSLILGILIVVILGILIYNFFNKPKGVTGPAQQTTSQQQADVAKSNLPGQYTVKAGDTLFDIAQKYYNDGNQFPEIMKANKLTDENLIVVGQVLQIPKMESSPSPSPSPSSNPDVSPSPTDPNQQSNRTQPVVGGTGGAINQTIWGEKITSDTYTVQPGDWLSKISGRAYGDIFQFDKIAKANNIANPNLIEPGMVLKIPR